MKSVLSYNRKWWAFLGITALALILTGELTAQKKLAHSAAINGVRERLGRAEGPDKEMILQQCIDLLTTDIANTEKAKDKEESYFYLGSIYFRKNDLVQAWNSYQKSLEYGKRFWEKQEKVTGGITLYSIKEALNDIKLKYFNQASRAYNEGANAATLDTMRLHFDKMFDRFLHLLEWDPKVEINGQSYVKGVYGTLAQANVLLMNKVTTNEERKKHRLEAIKYLEMLANSDKSNFTVVQFIVQLYDLDENYEKAIEWIDRFLGIETTDQEAQKVKIQLVARKGILLQVLNRPDEALKVYEDAIKKDPDNADLHFNLAGLYLNRNETDKALAEFMIVKRLSPNDVESNYQVGDAMFRLYLTKRKETIDKHGAEKADMKKVTETLKPHILEAQTALKDGLAVMEKNIATVQDVMETNYRIGKFYNYLAELEGHLNYTLENKEKVKLQKPYFEKAVEYLKKVVAEKNDHKTAWMHLGTAYMNLQMKKEAEAAFAKSK